MQHNQGKKCLVTGGGGFLGKALCSALISDGWEVTSVSRGSYPELEERGVRTIQADLAGDPEAFIHGFLDCEVVFHTAAKVDMWGNYEDFYRANVIATRNILTACDQAGVRRLVYTSSPSVIADGTDLRGVNEDYPYPDHYKAFYPQTKALAEREILSANSDRLNTVALRPHLIFGPGDTNLVPTVLKKAEGGQLACVGSGKNVVDLCYIKDCVAAHLCAARALETNPNCRGRAFFVSQGEPVPLWGWINEVLSRSGKERLSRKLPKSVASILATISEIVSGKLLAREPRLTRFLVEEMATDHYFDITGARTELGYQPRYSIQAAMNETFGDGKSKAA